MTDILKHIGFHWFDTAEASFEPLKVALTTSLLLAFPNFSLPFVVETKMCEVGVGAVLLQ